MDRNTAEHHNDANSRLRTRGVGPVYSRRSVLSLEFVQPVHGPSRQSSPAPLRPATHSAPGKNVKPSSAQWGVNKPGLMQDVAAGGAKVSFVKPQKKSATIAPARQKPNHKKPNKSGVLHRESVKKPRKIKKFVLIEKMTTSRLISACAAVLFVIGVAISAHTFLINKQATDQVRAVAGANTDDAPDETEPDPDTVANYVVAPDMPRYLKIDKINIHARIKRLGVDASNKLLAPSNIFDIGWYEGSVKPGENGTMLMDGHVSGPTKRGVFYNLKLLEQGDIVRVERGDGQEFSYRVVKKEIYPYDDVDMVAAIRSVEPGKNGLNLITCTGRFDAQRNDYDNRLIVFAIEI